MTTETNYAWAAGFIDADGFIGAPRFRHKGNKRDYYSVRLCAAQVKPAPLHRLAELFGGSVVAKQDKRGHHYTWTVYSEKAVAALEKMLPHLVQKKEQAELCLKMQETKSMSRRVSGDTHGVRASIYARLLELNSIRRSHAERLNELAPSLG